MDDTIAAISTPIGEGGIGIIRLSGPESLRIADEIFMPKNGVKPSKRKSHSVMYGHVMKSVIASDPLRGERSNLSCDKPIDEALLTVMKAPRTYTKEDIVEINCHGGIQAAKKVLDLVLDRGARLAEPGEFTKRAFLNGRIDLAQAEAVLDVIRSKTESSLKVAMAQLDGALSAEVDRIRDEVIDIAAHVEADIDFVDEEPDAAADAVLEKRSADIIRRLEQLVDSYGEGAIFREGVLAIICGKPNVGKSSLMNLLLKRDRVIVSPVPGTTRDTVEEMINLRGIPIRLVDTAGIARGRDSLEKEGIRRSKKYVEMADIALFMVDATAGLGREDRKILDLLAGKKKLVIINKIDAGKKVTAAKVRALCKGDAVIGISVREKTNIRKLENAIADLIWGGEYIQGEGAIVSNARHKELLDKALGNMVSVRRLFEEDASPDLVAVDLREAIVSLGLMIGKSVSDDILDRIFAQFCIGK